jgi:hypothetical protein
MKKKSLVSNEKVPWKNGWWTVFQGNDTSISCWVEHLKARWAPDFPEILR